MFEINKKADLSIPFHSIGDDDWEIQTRNIIQSISDNWDTEIAVPCSALDIQQLELRLKVTLPESLKLFYQIFGIADIGEQLQNFEDIGLLYDIWAKAPEYAPDFSEADLEVLPSLITFSDYLGNGNMFCFHVNTHEIYYFDHDSKPYLSKMFDRVDDYLKGCLIFAQADLFGLNIEQEQVEQWAEDVAVHLFGQATVKKWRY